eukprot:TRINITY_DN6772_c0_g1_i1.p1 TRINITY_DN6772_c0_g1~~TRINITY_DN6772_c0_g1_i1.p1  ORF type:complete len:573 (-),score=195.57 TRINITY_DN6772_c0_g1_i1:19-1737(-)
MEEQRGQIEKATGRGGNASSRLSRPSQRTERSIRQATLLKMAGLSNSDFRTIMMTPRRDQTPAAAKDMAPPSGKAKRKPFNPNKWKNNEGKSKKPPVEVGTLPQGYRDRAKERREGGADAEAIAEEEPVLLKTIVAKGDKESREKAIEQSKFLGGDMEHTHLVKGLDFALLTRKKKEMEFEEKLKELKHAEKQAKIESGEIAEDASDPESEDEPAPEEAQPFKIIDETKPAQPKKDKTAQIHTRVARGVYFQLFDKKVAAKSELFLPGRTLFTFDADPASDRDQPLSVLRSKDDCPQAKELMNDKMNDELLEQVDAIMTYLREDPKRRRSRRKEEDLVPTLPAPGPAPKPENYDEEDSIFGDIGEYVPEADREEPKPAGKSGSYFQDSQVKPESMEVDMSGSVPEGFASRLEEMQKQQQKHTEMREKLEAKKERLAKLGVPTGKGPTNVTDDYAECYPEAYQTLSFGELETGDDEDISKMDLGKKRKMRRKDFASEEAWVSYNETREALPKAAFQFGVKMNEGRKTKKNQGKANEKKFDRELKKINELTKKKENTASNVPTAQEKRKRMRLE